MKIRNKLQFKPTVLALSLMLLANHCFALQELNDGDLRNVNGQDGVDISLGFDSANIKQLYWEDTTGTNTTNEQVLRLNADTVSFAGFGGGTPNLNLKLNTGTVGSKVSMDARLHINPFTLSAQKLSICNTAVTPNCDPVSLSKYEGSIGNLGIQVVKGIDLNIVMPNGLFSSVEQGDLSLGLNNINLFLGQKQSLAATVQNQLLTKLNFNLQGKGYMYIDPVQGFVLTTNKSGATAISDSTPGVVSGLGYVDFARVDDPNKATIPTTQYGTYSGTNSGINIELSTVNNASVGVYNDTTAKGLIRVGASGRIVNGFLQMRGVNANGVINPIDDNAANTHTLNNILGMANTSNPVGTGANSTVVGSTGVGFRMKGEFTSLSDSMLGGDTSKASALEIGGAGKNSYGFEFSNLSPLISNSAGRAYFDSGNVYLNLANTKTVLLPQNSVLMTSRLSGGTNPYLTSANDYIQNIHNGTGASNPNSLILAIRGMQFQALSKQGRFTSGTGVDTAGKFTAQQNEWGLALPIYNLNANLATYATTYTGDVYSVTNGVLTKDAVTDSQRIGLSLAMSTEGRDATGSKTTSILVIDGGKNANNGNKPTDYYLGLRNIDMLLRGAGSMGFENGNVNVDMKKLLMVMSTELAAGYLPGAKYKTGSAVSPTDNFKLINDVLLAIKLKVLGDINFALIPTNAVTDGSSLTVAGDYNLTEGAIQLSDPVDGSMFGLDNLTGRVGFVNSIGIAPRTGNDYSANQQGNVSFNYSFNFNPNKNNAEVFRVKDINFYPPTSAQTTVGQRLGEMVFTGGRLSSSLTLAPRN